MYYALFRSGEIAGNALKFLIIMFVCAYVLRLLVIAVNFVRMRLFDKEGFDRFVAENEIKPPTPSIRFEKGPFPGKSSEASDISEEDDDKKVFCKATAKVIGKQEIKTYGTDEEGRPTTYVSYQLKIKFYVGNTAATASVGCDTYDDSVEIYYNKNDLSEVYLTSDERFKTGFSMQDFTIEGIRKASDKIGDKIEKAAQKNLVVNILVHIAAVLILVLALKVNSAL